nr:hypothetical protein [uncultured Holophaga sp.]
MDLWASMAGAITAVTGLEKGSGKTTFLDLALARLRPQGPVGVFSIGLDGTQKGEGAQVRVRPGDIVLSAERLVRASETRVELLEALPDRAGLGRLLLGRVLRGGSLTLAGCEHLSVLGGAIARVRGEGWAASILVDGAVDRLTQVSALGAPGAGSLAEPGFVFTARVEPANLERAAARMRGLLLMDGLPCGPAPGGIDWEGPLTTESLKRLPVGLPSLSVEDLTKLFLSPAELFRLRGILRLRRRLPLRALVVGLRGLDRAAFLRALGPEHAARVCFHPCEEAA